MKIGILSQWFDPEPGPAALPGALARALAARGHEIQVVTGFPNYPEGKIAPGYDMRRRLDEVRAGIKIRRVALYPSHSASIAGRLANYGSFGASALASGVGAFKGMNAIWVSNSPVTVGMPMWRIARQQRIPMVLHILDLWPDNILSSGLVKNVFASRTMENAVHRWNQSMYGRAEHIAGISPGIVELLASRGVPRKKLNYVPMWANEDAFFPSSDTSMRASLGADDDSVVALYAGTLGRTQDIETLVRACIEYPESAPPIECWIAGSGVEEDNLRREAATQSKPNVNIRFLGRIPAAGMTSVMASADVHFVGLRDDSNSRITMPSKIQATMASAKPMIIAIPGDAENAVMKSGSGFRADPGSVTSVTAALVDAAKSGRASLQQMGLASRECYETQFSLRAGSERIEELLLAAAANKVTP